MRRVHGDRLRCRPRLTQEQSGLMMEGRRGNRSKQSLSFVGAIDAPLFVLSIEPGRCGSRARVGYWRVWDIWVLSSGQR
jgi:hypothetical protein